MVEVSVSGRVKVTQYQRDSIVVRAIVGANSTKPEDPEDEEKDEPPPCGNPLNADGGGVADNPLDDEPEGEDGDDGSKGKNDPTPEGSRENNPLDEPGEGGYTPTCKEESEDNAAAESDGKTEN